MQPDDFTDWPNGSSSAKFTNKPLLKDVCEVNKIKIKNICTADECVHEINRVIRRVSFRHALFCFASNRCSFVADHRKCSGRRPSMTNRTRRETSSRKPLQRVSCEEVYRTIVVKRGAYAVRKKLISSPSCAH